MNQISKELLEKIYGYLPLQSVVALASVDKYQATVSNDGDSSERIWRTLSDYLYGGPKNKKLTWRAACKFNAINFRKHKKTSNKSVITWAVGGGHGALLRREWKTGKYNIADISDPKKIILSAMKECNVKMLEWCVEVGIDADWQDVFISFVKTGKKEQFDILLRVVVEKFKLDTNEKILALLESAMFAGNVTVVERLLYYSDDILDDTEQLMSLAATANNTKVWNFIKQRMEGKGEEGKWKEIVNKQVSTAQMLPILLFCALKKYAVSVQWLLENGANLNSKDSSGCYALHLCCTEVQQFKEAKQILDTLLQHGANINQLSDLADRHNDNEEEEEEKGEKEEVEEEERFPQARCTPLHYAVRDENLELVKYIIDLGADLTPKRLEGKYYWDDVQYTPYYVQPLLFSAAHSADMITLLLDNGVNPCVSSEDNNSNIFHMFLDENRLDDDSEDQVLPIFERLLAAGVNPVQQDVWKETPVHTCRRCYLPVWALKFFVEKGKMDLELKDEKGNTPLMLFSCYFQCVDYLLSKGADVNAHNQDNQTPLYFACTRGDHSVVERLIKAGAKVNVYTNTKKETPLHNASASENLEAAKLLVVNGADLLAKDYNGDIPLVVAQDEEIKIFLREKMEELNLEM